MVGGRRALLSVVVLGQTVLGGPLKPRDDSPVLVLEIETTTVPVITKKPPPIPPLVVPTATLTVVAQESLVLSLPPIDGGIQQTDTQAVAPPAIPTRPAIVPPAIPQPQPIVSVGIESLNFATVPGDGASTVIGAGTRVDESPQQTTTRAGPPALPTRPGAVPPAIPPPKLVVSLEPESIDFGTGPGGGDGTVVGGNSRIGVDGSPAAVTTTEEYVYPGIWGASGPLTTNINGPTRSTIPTIQTVVPVPSVRLPPGSEAPGVPTNPDGNNYAPHEDALASTTTVPAVVPTPPRGPPPSRPTTNSIIAVEQSSVDLGQTPGGRGPDEYGASTTASFLNFTAAVPDPTAVTPVSYCQASDLTKATTSYSVVYTSTLTWYGNPEDYTPEYPPISTPPPTPACVTMPDPARFTVSTIAFCSSTGAGTKFVTCLTTTSTWRYDLQSSTTAALFNGPEAAAPGTVIIITTDKNPAVVYPTKKAPNYGITSAPITRDTRDPATNNVPITTPGYGAGGGTTQNREPPTTNPVTVAVKPTAVVINDNTIIDDPAGNTQVVVVSGVTFTIGPTQVVGGGATIDRNAVTGGVFLPTPTTTTLGGLQVVVSSSIAIVGGSSFSLGNTPRTAVVSGQTVVVSPTAVAVGGQTLTLPTLPAPTEEVVAGGDLITAIGQSVVVIQSTTITYGLTGISTTVIDDDTITFGPDGVTVRGTVLGGRTAKPGETDFAVVGGATITKVGASVAVIGGHTFTIGPGTGTTTTVVGGETITIGPNGITLSTLSLGWPFGPTTVITPGATATEAVATAAAAEDGALGLRPDGPGVVAAVCLAVGLAVLGV
ncbi:hypothetical protein OQA88_2731 [Cercophora sp. LCS_1]